MPKFIKHYKHPMNHETDKGIKNDKPSMTIQGEAKSLKEMIANPNDAEIAEPVFMDVEDIGDINHFYSPNVDISELEELKKYNEQNREEIQSAIEKKKEEKEKEKKADESKQIDLEDEIEKNESKTDGE